MDKVDKVEEVIEQLLAVLQEGEVTYDPATVVTALVYVAGLVVAQVAKQHPDFDAVAIWRRQFDTVYTREIAL